MVNKEGKVYTYELQYSLKSPGIFKSALRLYPKNAELPHRQDFAYTRWF